MISTCAGKGGEEVCIPPHSTPAWRSLNVVILRWVHPDGADALPGVAGSGALESEGRWMMEAEETGAGR